MSHSRRFRRIATIAVTGLFVLVGLAPGASAASAATNTSITVSGPGWCC